MKGRVVVVSLVFAVLLAAPTVVAQKGDYAGAFATSGSDWEGYSEFVRLAQRQVGTSRIRPTARLQYDQLEPADAVIIVRPETELDENSLSAFLADGGRVALLDDFGKGDSLLKRFGIFRSPAPPDPEQRLRNNADLAVAVPSKHYVPGTSDAGFHPMTLHVEAVVTNHPVALRHPNLTPVLEIHDKSGTSSDIAITGVIEKRGRLFAMGDPSVFINLMLRYPGNRHFAQGLVDYLSERVEASIVEPTNPTTTSAEGRVWIVANDFAQVGRYGSDPGFFEQLLSKLKELKASGEKIQHDGLPPGLAMALAAFLSVWALSTMIARNLRGGELHLLSFSRPHALAAQAGLGARASILAAKESNPVLALLELDAALRETVARRLGLNAAQPRERLSKELQEQGLSRKDSESLCNLLVELRTHGESLSKAKWRGPTEHLMKRVHEESMRLLNEIERTSGKR